MHLARPLPRRGGPPDGYRRRTTDGRVRMHECGMPAPVLQKELRTPDGHFVGRAGFLWEDEGVVGEFDDMGRYDGGIEAVRREQRREDALRELGFEVVRWTWPELFRFDVVRVRFDRAVARARRQSLPPSSSAAAIAEADDELAHRWVVRTL